MAEVFDSGELEQTETTDDRAEGDLVRPSLQLHEFEGRVHSYQGMLSQRTKLKKWRKRWFRVAPSKSRFTVYRDIYQPCNYCAGYIDLS